MTSPDPHSELLAPLDRLLAFTEVLESTDLDAQQRKQVHGIRDCGEQLRHLIDSSSGKLLNFKVLLVEDNAVSQQVALQVLKLLGCRVDVAENGSVALEKLEQGAWSFQAVLMDCQMPVMDGYEATGHIRRRATLNAAATLR